MLGLTTHVLCLLYMVMMKNQRDRWGIKVVVLN